MSEEQSRSIDLLRCILIVFVVLIHTNLMVDTDCSHTLYPAVVTIAGQVVWLATVMFFALSGYLFFPTGSLSWAEYGAKLRRRVQTWLIPYVAWNTLYLLLYFCGYAVVPGLMGAVGHPIGEMAPIDWITAYTGWTPEWNDFGPIDGPLWFLRDLMLLALLAPFIGYVIRLSRLSALILPVLFCIEVPFFNMGSLVFFSLGAFLRIWNVKVPSAGWKALWLPTAVFVCTAIATVLCETSMPLLLGYCIKLTETISGMWMLVGLAHLLAPHVDPARTSYYAGAVFFVFAMHGALARAFTKVASMLLGHFSLNGILLTGVHVLNAALTILICFVVYALVKRYTPRLGRIWGVR